MTIPETRAAADRVRAFLDARDESLAACGIPRIGPGVVTSWHNGENDYELTADDLRTLLAAADADTPSAGARGRCPRVLIFPATRDQPDERCALYDGHPGRHQTQPLAPIREDGADGVHMFLWTSDARGIVTEVNEQRIDDDPDETLGDLDV